MSFGGFGGVAKNIFNLGAFLWFVFCLTPPPPPASEDISDGSEKLFQQQQF
jgi:hypothetical protein